MVVEHSGHGELWVLQWGWKVGRVLARHQQPNPMIPSFLLSQRTLEKGLGLLVCLGAITGSWFGCGSWQAGTG